MSRQKKVEENNEQEFTYCGITKCPHTECLRHHINEPWDVLVHEKKFKPDKEWNCKDLLK